MSGLSRPLNAETVRRIAEALIGPTVGPVRLYVSPPIDGVGEIERMTLAQLGVPLEPDAAAPTRVGADRSTVSDPADPMPALRHDPSAASDPVR